VVVGTEGGGCGLFRIDELAASANGDGQFYYWRLYSWPCDLIGHHAVVPCQRREMLSIVSAVVGAK
jgi:hypothetical protein